MKYPEIVGSKGRMERHLKPKPRSRRNALPRVISTETGVIYDSLSDAAEDIYVSYPNLWNKLTGKNKNNTDLIMLEKEN